MKSKARLRTLAPRMKNDTCANSWTAKEKAIAALAEIIQMRTAIGIETY